MTHMKTMGFSPAALGLADRGNTPADARERLRTAVQESSTRTRRHPIPRERKYLWLRRVTGHTTLTWEEL